MKIHLVPPVLVQDGLNHLSDHIHSQFPLFVYLKVRKDLLDYCLNLCTFMHGTPIKSTDEAIVLPEVEAGVKHHLDVVVLVFPGNLVLEP